MSAYDDGYAKGYEDAINGDDSRYNSLTGVGMAIMDAFIPPIEEESEWSEGYIDGWKAGNEEK